jgi:hypothetical protein
MSKWTREEEHELVKDISQGFQFDHIAIKKGRSASAIELRLKKIIYENVMSGKTFETLSKVLKMDSEKLRQYFYSYKDFKEKHTGQIEDIAGQKSNNSDIYIKKTHVSEIPASTNLFSKIQHDIDKIGNNGHAQHGGQHTKSDNVSISGLENKIKKLELENKLIGLVVENKNLNTQLNKLVKEGKVDKSIKTTIKNIRGGKL